jgi:arylformamidase
MASPAAVPFAHLDRAELDRQLSPSRSAKDPWGVLRRHEVATASLDEADGLRVVRDRAYGPRRRERLDLFVPDRPGSHPCLAFIHGGFWQEGSKAGSGFAALSLAAAGWACAGIGYTLTPEVRLREIVREAAAAILWLQREAPSYGLDPARLVVAGHSAGGHLAAALVAGLGGEAAAAAVSGAVLVSGVYDLAPVAASYVNDLARIDDAEVRELSPLFARPVRDVPVHLVVGADEPEAFQRQSDALCAAWRPSLSHLTVGRVAGRDHFDVLDELADPATPTFRTLLEMAS